MNMIELNDLLPSAQWEDNWIFYGAEHEGLPNDTDYVVFEYYCDNPDCHCETLRATVLKLDAGGRAILKPLAVIHYDWSSPQTACSPTLDEQFPQTATTQHLLEVYKKFIHHPDYLIRIKEHYARVKTLAAARDLKKGNKQNVSSNKNLGRNDPCPCGSGKKNKKCCLGKEGCQNK